jgi:WD40 repeat protein
LATVGTDKKLCFFDGKTGDFQKEVVDAHAGGIYGCSWGSDNRRLLTASADKTCKIWDTTNLQVLKTFKFGDALEDQQLGCLWQGNDILSINLLGDLSYLNEAHEGPFKIVMGHSTPIEAMAYNRANDHFYTSDRTGRVIGWNRLDSANVAFKGDAHKSKVCSMAIDSNILYTVALDDSIKATNLATHQWGEGIKLSSQPVAVTAGKGCAFVACKEAVLTVRSNQVVSTLAAPWGPVSIAVSYDGSHVAVGGNDKLVHVYENQNGTLKQKYTNSHDGAVVSVAWSLDGTLLASGCTDRQVKVWNGQTKTNGAWGMGGRVDQLQFSPGGQYLCSAGLDSNFILWSIRNNARAFEQKNAHIGGVRGLEWVDDHTLLSTGADLLTKAWNVSLS